MSEEDCEYHEEYVYCALCDQYKYPWEICEDTDTCDTYE